MLKTKIGPPAGKGFYVMTNIYEDTMRRGKLVPGSAVTRVFRRDGDRCIYDSLDFAACENRVVRARRQHEAMVKRWTGYHLKGDDRNGEERHV